MALRTIVQDGDPILKKKCRPVTAFDDRLAQLLDDMRETLADANGYGLAGPQVGVMRRIFISIDERDLPEDGERPEDYETKYLEFINPEILSTEGEIMQYEGCLSFPGRNGAVRRPAKVKARAFDRNGNPFEIEAEGMLARCICHENDHLNGVTILDRAEYFYEDLEEDEIEEEE
ncbi:peptide deformylase [Ruthenibacterium sp. CLA-JM-H11]|uniref:Peptide deformylase n=1 Tax=Ruthenibacterium intestinale TaxID=3133163 RepID=A0ABV1GDQ8_9FIRM